MTVRIFDIIPMDVNEFSKNKQPANFVAPLYNPSNLGGGFSRDVSGALVANNETITFSMIFKTDIESTGYTKYKQTVEALASRDLVWLRYAVPNSNGEYTFAYRPGFISAITKTEAKYQNGELSEKVSLTTVGPWFQLCEFSVNSTSIDLTAANITNHNNGYRVFSKNPKMHKFGYPYWYKKLVVDVVKEVVGWYTKWGNPLQEGDKKDGLFAIHAPSISPIEDAALSSNTEQFEYQMNRIKGKSFVNEGTNMNFGSSIENYSSDYQRTRDDYSSFLLIGEITAQKCVIAFKTARGSAVTNQFTISEASGFHIDSAPWANFYGVNHGNNPHDLNRTVFGGIDASLFTKTTATRDETLTITGGRFTTVIMRKEILCV